MSEKPMDDEGYLRARGWAWGPDTWARSHGGQSTGGMPTAEAVETQIAEDRAVAGYLAARGVPAGDAFYVSTSGGVAGGGSGAAIVSRVSGPVGFTGGAPQGLTRVVPEAFVEAAQTLADFVFNANSDPFAAPWDLVRKAAETVAALDRKPR